VTIWTCVCRAWQIDCPTSYLPRYRADMQAELDEHMWTCTKVAAYREEY
jgi:hypothetical protein